MKPPSTSRSGAWRSMARPVPPKASRLAWALWSTTSVAMPWPAQRPVCQSRAGAVGDDRDHARRPALGGAALHDGFELLPRPEMR